PAPEGRGLPRVQEGPGLEPLVAALPAPRPADRRVGLAQAGRDGVKGYRRVNGLGASMTAPHHPTGTDPPPPGVVPRRTFLASLGVVLAAVRARAQGVAEEPGKTASQLDAMRRLAKTATFAEVTDGRPGPPLVLRTEPLLLYGDPGRGIREGTL